MADFDAVKNELASILEVKKIAFKDWGDAISIRFSDTCDDFYYTAICADLPQEFIDRFLSLDASRSRIINALRHYAVKKDIFLERNQSGSWSAVNSKGESCRLEVGRELTLSLEEQGEVVPFRNKLNELSKLESENAACCPLELFTNCISRIAYGLKHFKDSIYVDSSDKQVIAYIDSHSQAPEKEVFQEIKNQDDRDDGDFQVFFDKYQKTGPKLSELDERKTAEIDHSSSLKIEEFLDSPDGKSAHEKFLLPWFDEIDDKWLKNETLVCRLKSLIISAQEEDLLKEETQYLKSFTVSPEKTMAARRRFILDIEREWNELKKFSRQDRVVKLNDILEIIEKIPPDLVKVFMTEEQLQYIYNFSMEAVRWAPVEDLQFTHEHILNVACKMNWPEIAKTLRQRDDYTTLLFGFSIPASEMTELTGKTMESEDMPEIFDAYYFSKSLLAWSLYMPDEYTRRLTATAIDLLNKGKGSEDDYLACSIAWQRCRVR